MNPNVQTISQFTNRLIALSWAERAKANKLNTMPTDELAKLKRDLHKRAKSLSDSAFEDYLNRMYPLPVSEEQSAKHIEPSENFNVFDHFESWHTDTQISALKILANTLLFRCISLARQVAKQLVQDVRTRRAMYTAPDDTAEDMAEKDRLMSLDNANAADAHKNALVFGEQLRDAMGLPTELSTEQRLQKLAQTRQYALERLDVVTGGMYGPFDRPMDVPSALDFMCTPRQSRLDRATRAELAKDMELSPEEYDEMAKSIAQEDADNMVKMRPLLEEILSGHMDIAKSTFAKLERRKEHDPKIRDALEDRLRDGYYSSFQDLDVAERHSIVRSLLAKLEDRWLLLTKVVMRGNLAVMSQRRFLKAAIAEFKVQALKFQERVYGDLVQAMQDGRQVQWIES